MRAEPAAPTETTAATGPISDGSRWLLPAGVVPLAVALVLYLTDLLTHLSQLIAGNIFVLAGPAAVAALRCWLRRPRISGM